MDIKLSKEIIQVINIIKNNGYEAYVVGGYVRDSLLNIDNYDVYITTSATPQKLKQLLKDYNIDDKYIDLGSVKFNLDKYHFEITTFRKEYNYVNHRRPNKVEFTTSLKDDLNRRDFAINALCSDGEQLIDLFNGIDDLNSKVIRTIGDAFVRLKEDSLRILRAIRFASKLGFEIDDNLEKAINDNCEYLSVIPFQTKYRELRGFLEGEYYIKVLKAYKEVFKKCFCLNDLKIDLFKKNMKYDEKEALFFYFSNVNVNNKYLINKEIEFNNDKIDLKKKLNLYGKDNVYNVLYFKSHFLGVNKEEFEMLKKIINNNECYNLKMLDIKGNDLIEFNIKNDKIGKHLEILLNAVINNECVNSKSELLKYLKNNIIECEE